MTTTMKAMDIDIDPARIDRIEHDLRMPKYMFHCPIDASIESHAPEYPAPIIVPGEPFPLPPSICRPGYAPDDDELYLRWGKSDHDEIMNVIERHYGSARALKHGMKILDFGCSSGRVLRHFYAE